PTRRREREVAGIRRSETLEHGQERGRARRAQPLEGVAHGVLGAKGNDELVLHHARPAIEAVPPFNAVEGMEERGDRLDVADPLTGRLAEPELVEGAHRQSVEQVRWSPGRRREQGAWGELPRRPPFT